MTTHPLDSYAPTSRTYPGDWLVIAVLAAIVALWLPVMILGVVGAVVLGAVNIWKESHNARRTD